MVLIAHTLLLVFKIHHFNVIIMDVKVTHSKRRALHGIYPTKRRVISVFQVALWMVLLFKMLEI